MLLLSFDFMSSWGCLNYRLTFTGPSPSPASPQCLNSQLSCAGVSDKDHFSRCVRRREVCFTGTKIKVLISCPIWDLSLLPPAVLSKSTHTGTRSG